VSSFSHRQMVVSLREATGADMGAEFGHTPARKRLAHVSGECTCDGFNAHEQLRGKARGRPGGENLPGLPVVFRRTVFASG